VTRPKELLKALRDASKDNTGGLELLASGRHEVRVYKKLFNPVIINLSRSVPDTDMIKYIITEVKDGEKDERILKGEHNDLEDRHIEILYRRAGGMYDKSLDCY
jgi:hypothetical protein